MIFPTNFSPKNEVRLENGLTLKPHKRAVLKYNYGNLFTDTLVVENLKNIDALKNWVIFHSFIFDSRLTLKTYEKSEIGKLEEIEDENTNKIDFNHILPSVYFLHEKNIKNLKKSYQELYTTFEEKEFKIKQLIINYLTDLDKQTSRPMDAITDTSYWQLMIYYSVIEAILGRQDFCENIHNCKECKKENIWHHPLSTNEWLIKRLDELIPDNPGTQKCYAEIIKAANGHIRNDTVHKSIVPTAKHSPKEINQEIIYTLEKSINDFREDKAALESLIHQLKDVARFLLLEKLFELKIFPIPNPLRSVTIGAQ